MEKFIIIGDNTNRCGNLLSLTGLEGIRYVDLKKIDFIYKTGKVVQMELSVNAASGGEYYNYVTDSCKAALNTDWNNPVGFVFGGPKNAAGEYSGELPILDSAGDLAVVTSVTYS